MITTEEQAMRREALEEAASYAHPEANAPDTLRAPPPDIAATAPFGLRFHLAIRAALVGAIACLAVACGGRIDAGADPSSAPERVTCATPEGSTPLPASSVVVTAADGALRASESCENGAACYVVSSPPPSGRGSEIMHVVRGSCVVEK